MYQSVCSTALSPLLPTAPSSIQPAQASRSNFSKKKFLLLTFPLLFMGYILLTLFKTPPETSSSPLKLSSDSYHFLNPLKLELLASLSKVSALPYVSPNGPAVISRDNLYLAFPTSEGKIQVRSLENFSSIASFSYSKLGGFSWFVAFSNDNKSVASISEGPSVKLWDIKSKSEILSLRHVDRIDSIAISKDDKYIITACHDAIRVWSIQTKGIVHEFTLEIGG